ncbi:LuxR C-terminal-related transcriptional regulator [Paenibacillus alginolyticus]|uniref:response regulator transcription factor n=1 Tax=Paenibacillus alginolyticus TaxID=59839 RepID=UPI00040CC4D4|nr:LuxR C-terminal-related transcriptional regulator [Paenibacillus alginolyticus]MCY9666439.1 LuxR C-terminal-related transcriptional regulator [Paenibacillus alginolyticus]
MSLTLILSPVTLYVSKRFEFTQRETEIYNILILNGYSNKEIADALDISERTVRNHIQRMMEKTGMDSAKKMMAIGIQAISI